MDVWDVWRAVNVAVAIVALMLHLVAFSDDPGPTRGSVMGRMSNMAWCFCYSAACIIATILPGGSPGPWTAIMSVPAGWSLVTGAWLVRDRSV